MRDFKSCLSARSLQICIKILKLKNIVISYIIYIVLNLTEALLKFILYLYLYIVHIKKNHKEPLFVPFLLDLFYEVRKKEKR